MGFEVQALDLITVINFNLYFVSITFVCLVSFKTILVRKRFRKKEVLVIKCWNSPTVFTLWQNQACVVRVSRVVEIVRMTFGSIWTSVMATHLIQWSDKKFSLKTYSRYGLWKAIPHYIRSHRVYAVSRPSSPSRCRRRQAGLIFSKCDIDVFCVWTAVTFSSWCYKFFCYMWAVFVLIWNCVL